MPFMMCFIPNSNMSKGSYEPSYLMTLTKSGRLMVKNASAAKIESVALFSDVFGNEAYVNQMLRFCEENASEQNDLVGAVFMLECDRYGKFIGYTNPNLIFMASSGEPQLPENPKRNDEILLSTLFSQEPRASPFLTSGVRKSLPQVLTLTLRRRREKAERENQKHGKHICRT